MIEVWKPIENYVGYYEVSNQGRVRSVQRFDSLGRIKYGFLLSGSDNGRGYLSVQLVKNGNKKRKYIHRLVAEAFLPNAEGRNEVNHKDETTNNNSVDNLEWCDRKYNCNYGSHSKKISESKGTKFIVINNNTGEKATFNSKDIASKELHIGRDKVVQGLSRGRVVYSFGRHKRDFTFALAE